MSSTYIHYIGIPPRLWDLLGDQRDELTFVPAHQTLIELIAYCWLRGSINNTQAVSAIKVLAV